MTARELGPFACAEFEARAERTRRLMARARLDAVLVSTEANLGYLSGFSSQLPWLTPARPWYFLLPRRGEPVGIIPDSGVDAWRATSWVADLRTWRSPNPENEGLDLIAAAIADLKSRYGRVGFELGPESRLGFPVADLLRLKEMIGPVEMADGSGVLREVRMIKSPAEIARIRRAARIACNAFDALPTAFE
ncbi:MAG: aminopeptidase P family protein, partial [Rhodospirillaceae bacterium]|nr:aminopeptidase P family protein [Rhodospirillaceae bacterium]